MIPISILGGWRFGTVAEGVGGAAKPQTASLSTKAESLIQN